MQRVQFPSSKKEIFRHYSYTGNHNVKAVISVLFTVIMGVLVLLTGPSCIVNILHHHHHTYNQNGEINRLDCFCCIKYNRAINLQYFLRSSSLNWATVRIITHHSLGLMLSHLHVVLAATVKINHLNISRILCTYPELYFCDSWYALSLMPLCCSDWHVVGTFPDALTWVKHVIQMQESLFSLLSVNLHG